MESEEEKSEDYREKKEIIIGEGEYKMAVNNTVSNNRGKNESSEPDQV